MTSTNPGRFICLLAPSLAIVNSSEFEALRNSLNPGIPFCNTHAELSIFGECWYNCTIEDISGEDKKKKLHKALGKMLASFKRALAIEPVKGHLCLSCFLHAVKMVECNYPVNTLMELCMLREKVMLFNLERIPEEVDACIALSKNDSYIANEQRNKELLEYSYQQK